MISNELLLLIGIVISIVVVVFTPFAKSKAVQVYNFIVKKLGKDFANILVALSKALISYIKDNKGKIYSAVSKKTNGKVSKEDIEKIEEGYKKGKDIIK
ncbi:hypothetical protein [Cytobacillus sp. NCCP-133]|uniref:hypothetical protein n=1 Tax=Cytobacillus sp. NCCP-133 TaxID=766848 RepID=UPI00222F5978|nr:hypothetical protein [Cytobacillus sp. NCCP-133]GLB58685.1 hypothetical protein NCCP133_08180 [Cytobacillus sp. NCCP-133]